MYNNYMNPEASHSLPESFFQEILTIYSKFSIKNDELTIKFNEDISTVINKLFEILKGFDDVQLSVYRKMRILSTSWKGSDTSSTT
jgi:hypothetical protein